MDSCAACHEPVMARKPHLVLSSRAPSEAQPLVYHDVKCLVNHQLEALDQGPYQVGVEGRTELTSPGGVIGFSTRALGIPMQSFETRFELLSFMEASGADWVKAMKDLAHERAREAQTEMDRR